MFLAGLAFIASAALQADSLKLVSITYGGVPPAPEVITSIRVRERAVRFGVQCMKGGPAAYEISIIRYRMTDTATNNVLAENIQAVKYRFSCGAKKSTQSRSRRKVKSTTPS